MTRPGRDRNQRLLGFARQMRGQATDAERKMWAVLRADRLAGFKFRRQHPMGGFILDFYCPERLLAVELDGGQHADADRVVYDQRRTKALSEIGVKIIRFWDNDALKHAELVAEQIYHELCARKESGGNC